MLERELPYWYVHTWDRTRDAQRTFRLDRMRDADVLDETFEPRPGLAPRKLSDSRTARVLYSKQVARWRLERPVEIRPRVDGSAVEELAVGSADWLVGEILAWAGEAVVLEPAELRREVADRARALLKARLSRARARARR